jgi:Spy/CpxP family protein refolding chaperone
MKMIKILILTIALAMTGMPAFAQRQMPGPPFDDGQGNEGEFSPGQGRGGPPSKERREEIRKKIEAIRIWRLTEELKLDEKTAAKFFPLLSSLAQRRNELMRENMEAERELRLYLEAGKPDEKKIKAALDRLENIHRETAKLAEKEIDITKAHLTVEQQARYYLFQQDFQREMREMISGARGGMGPQGARGGQGQRGMRGMGDNPRPGGPPDEKTRGDGQAFPPGTGR